MQIARLQKENDNFNRLLFEEKRKHDETKFRNKLMVDSLALCLSNVECQRSILHAAIDMNNKLQMTQEISGGASNYYNHGQMVTAAAQNYNNMQAPTFHSQMPLSQQAHHSLMGAPPPHS